MSNDETLIAEAVGVGVGIGRGALEWGGNVVIGAHDPERPARMALELGVPEIERRFEADLPLGAMPNGRDGAEAVDLPCSDREHCTREWTA